MHDITTHTNQVFSPFGSGYVVEQSLNDSERNIAVTDIDGVISLLTVAMFEEMLASLRSSLSLRKE